MVLQSGDSSLTSVESYATSVDNTQLYLTILTIWWCDILADIPF